MKKKINIPIYHGTLVIHQVKDKSKVIREYNLGGFNLNWDQYDAFVFTAEPGDGTVEYHMVFEENCKPYVIVHECVHVANRIFRDRDIKLSVKNDEPQAYMVEWVSKQCFNYLKWNKGD